MTQEKDEVTITVEIIQVEQSIQQHESVIRETPNAIKIEEQESHTDPLSLKQHIKIPQSQNILS